MVRFSYVVFEKADGEDCHSVYVKDFDTCTQGVDLEESKNMAKELVEFLVFAFKEDGTEIPEVDSGKVENADVDLAVVYEGFVEVEI